MTSKKQPTRGIDRVGIGTDLHRLEAGRPMILGHVPIEFDRGPAGHSDADVVLHAIIDALCGAAGLPDIGELFPDTDAGWKDADSADLLSQVLPMITEAGYAPVNVDVTIHAEKPKIGPYKPAIRGELARLLQLPADAVSIKAKTNEGVDAVGRGEAIACTVVAGLRALSPD